MPFVSVEGDNPAEIHYDVFGSGRPVVLIHGWPLSSRSWEAQVPALVEAGYQVVTYDRRGFGNSSQPWSGYDYDTFTADLDAVLTAVDARDAVLVGFSMGGGEVARYIGRHGTNRVGAAVFAAAVPPYLHREDDNPDGGLDDQTIEQFEDGVTSDRPAFLEGFVRDFMSAGDDVTTSDATLGYLRTIAEFASPKGTLDCIGAFARTDFRRDLAGITVPTLVIHGDSDAVVPFEVSGRRTHEAVAGSTLVVIQGGPHGINASHPEEFNDALLEFLSSSTNRDHGEAPVANNSAGRHAVIDAAPAAADPTLTQSPAVDELTTDRPAPTAAEPDGHDVGEPTSPRDQTPDEPSAADTNAAGPEGVSDAAPADAAPADDEPTDRTAEPRDAAPAAQSEPPSTSGPTDEDSARDTGLTGLTWRTAEADDPANRAVEPTGDHARRAGWTADPNLGDVPVDRQPHPGT